MSETDANTDLSPPDWAEALFRRPLTAIGGGAGAPVWALKDDRIAAHISEQFTLNAGAYHARYAASAHFQALFEQAIRGLGLTIPPAPLIFDMGSGSGVNSIVPCLALFPGARQVATDLSGELLAILAAYAAEAGLSDRVICVVMDAMGGQVARERFDLVTGAAILHHLTHPTLGVEAAARALKPGCQAIFFEPFDGYGLMRLAYERILAEAELRAAPLEPAVAQVLRGMVDDIAARTSLDRASEAFANLDDKWLFSQRYIEAVARDCGFERVRLLSHNDHASLYRDAALVQLRLGSGVADLTLPDWAMDILDSFDRAMPQLTKSGFMLEGTIVMTKAG